MYVLILTKNNNQLYVVLTYNENLKLRNTTICGVNPLNIQIIGDLFRQSLQQFEY